MNVLKGLPTMGQPIDADDAKLLAEEAAVAGASLRYAIAEARVAESIAAACYGSWVRARTAAREAAAVMLEAARAQRRQDSGQKAG